MNVYPFIEAEKACSRNVKRACELLKVSRVAFCQHLSGPSRREQQDVGLAEEIRAVRAGSTGRYGAPRVRAQLARDGHRHGRKRVARIMRSAGLRGRAAKRWKRTTIADPPRFRCTREAPRRWQELAALVKLERSNCLAGAETSWAVSAA